MPKQFLDLAGKPVLMHTIEAFDRYSKNLSIIVVLPQSNIPLWNSLCLKHHFSHDYVLVTGGNSRTASVKNGLDKIEDPDSLVAIHDGVRPLIRPEIISASFRLAQVHGCAVAATRLKESLRQVDKDKTMAIDRSKYRSIQTPQTFQTSIIKEAYKQLENKIDFTDDASVAEMQGLNISLFEGSYENIKITTPEDLLFAEAILIGKK